MMLRNHSSSVSCSSRRKSVSSSSDSLSASAVLMSINLRILLASSRCLIDNPSIWRLWRAYVAGEPTDVRYYAVAYGNKLDQRRTLSQRSAVVPTPVNIMFLNINIIHYLYHKYSYLYHIVYILYSKSKLMNIASYGQAVTSARHHHLATTVLLLPYRTLRSWTTGAWEP